MSTLSITDAVKQFGVTSKTLRYYERIGLLNSTRHTDNNYRHYNATDIERIKQIIILRKMQIPIKDILRIYESKDTSVVVEIFCQRIDTIDNEVNALSKLRDITNEFLQTMLTKGITKISVLPLLYEEMDKHLVSVADVETIAEKFAKMPDIRIIDLPAMRVITSRNDCGQSMIDDFWDWIQKAGLATANPGAHKLFEFQPQEGDSQSILMLQVLNEFANNSDFQVMQFPGGLFAAASVYADDDLELFHRAMVNSIDENSFYEMDYTHDGRQRHPTLIETLISMDDTRELLDILIPIKRKMPDALLYKNVAEPKEIRDITPAKIELANPVSQSHCLSLDSFTPFYKDGYGTIVYDVLPDGSINFNPYVSTRFLSTNLSVRLPFRLDMEFMTDLTTKDCRLIFLHGKNQYIIRGAKTEIDISFTQPVHMNWMDIRETGCIHSDKHNHISWIIGEEHFAVIINGEVHYCGVNFPYMLTDFRLLPAHTIMLGGSGDIINIKSLTISQLKYTPKIRAKKEQFNMITKQSNNILPNIRMINRGDKAENHEFNGAAAYVMECIGETTFGEFKDDVNEPLWFFEGLTGDILTQAYSHIGHQGWARSDYLYGKEFVTDIFDKCGYASTFITPEEFASNQEMYTQTITAYIDKGVPVIFHEYPYEGACSVIVGYEDYGKTLLFVPGSNTDTVEKIAMVDDMKYSWVFVGAKKRDVNVAELYRNMIMDLPRNFEQKTDTYCFGPNAFAAWAKDTENGGYEPDGVYVIMLSTALAAAWRVFEKVTQHNPDMGWVWEVHECYKKIESTWNDGWDTGADESEKNRNNAEIIRAMGRCMEEAVGIIKSLDSHTV